MKKKELVYLQMLNGMLEKHIYTFTQLGIARELGISISTINNALKPLVKMRAISVRHMNFTIRDRERVLLFSASCRNMEKDITYRTRVDAPISRIEKDMPSGAIYTAYTGYKFRYADVPADYGEVYVYASDATLREIKRRFPKKSGRENLIVLKLDPVLKKLSKNNIAPLPQIYVDLWNINTWYAKEFLKGAEKRMKW